jgi:N4-gp56 family major capsid protein
VAVQTYGGLTAQQRSFYEMTLLERLLPERVMLDQGLKASIPKHQGLQAQWRFWASLALATTPLTEGSPPSDSALSITTVTATIAQILDQAEEPLRTMQARNRAALLHDVGDGTGPEIHVDRGGASS